jgi:urease accessory protein
VDPAGELFFVDQLMPGRVGHGEAWNWDRQCLELSVRVGGELVLRERMDHSADELRAMAELAGSGSTACFANAVLISPAWANADEPGWRAAVRSLHGAGQWVGVSTLRAGGWSIKLVAQDGMRLRDALRDVRRLLAACFPRLGCDLRKL